MVMRTLKRQWIVVLGGAACLVATTFLSGFAAEGHGHMGHGGHDQEEQDDHSAHYLKHLLKHAKEIGLTPEQIGKVKAMQLDFKRTEARLEADIKIAKLELHALLEDEKADLNTIQAKVEQLKTTEGSLLFAAIKSKHHAMAMLSPDQREKDRVHREQMKSEGQGQHGGGMGGMGGGGMMGGMGGMMGGGSHGGQSGGDHGGGDASGGQQHQH
jgi:protein CpxP